MESTDWKSFMQIQPPGARGKFDEALFTRDGWMAEEKLDGDRRIAQFCPWTAGRAKVRFTGRLVSKDTKLLVEKTDRVPHLNGDYGLDPAFPPGSRDARSVVAPATLVGTVLDGEMTVNRPGARSKDVTSIIGSKPEDAIQKQKERGWLVYVVFDCLFYKGRDIRHLPLTERAQYMTLAIQEWDHPYVKIASGTVWNREEFLNEIWNRPQPGEGIILKDLSAPYGNEKAWVKVKREQTEDVVIMGYEDPEKITEKKESYKDADGVKRYRVVEVSESRLAKNGWIGAVRFGQYKALPPAMEGTAVTNYEIAPGVPKYIWKDGVGYELTYCGKCSGMNDDLRAKFSENKDAFKGQVMEILANEREEDTGAFRHPRFVQLRDNKNAVDCLWEQK